MGNKKEFKALIKKYKSITLEDIMSKGRFINNRFDEESPATMLTGFGRTRECTLCLSVDANCDSCYWFKKSDDRCNDGINEKSYNKIYYAETPEDLLKAFKKRAKYMKKVLTNK